MFMSSSSKKDIMEERKDSEVQKTALEKIITLAREEVCLCVCVCACVHACMCMSVHMYLRVLCTYFHACSTYMCCISFLFSERNLLTYQQRKS